MNIKHIMYGCIAVFFITASCCLISITHFEKNKTTVQYSAYRGGLTLTKETTGDISDTVKEMSKEVLECTQ